MRLTRRRPRWELRFALIVCSQLLVVGYFLLYGTLYTTRFFSSRLFASNSLRRCITRAHRVPQYVKPGICITATQRLRALEDLVYALKVMLENAHVVYWIDSGTLLGVYRAQQLVPWDYNVDIGILVAGYDYIRSTDHETLNVPEGYRLTVFNSSLYDAGDTSVGVPVKFVDTKFGFYANMFAFQEFEGLFKDDVRSADAPLEEVAVVGNGVIVETLVGLEPSEIWHRCVHCPVVTEDEDSDSTKDFNAPVVKQFRIPRDWVFPLRWCKLELFEVMCPAQTAPYLMYIFGNRFLTPELWE